jgi:hypothetical protein
MLRAAVHIQAERRKKLEPFEVPKSGHFYLHDDRRGAPENEDDAEEEEGRDARPERKKLWAGDQGKWKHDKFDDEAPVCRMTCACFFCSLLPALHTHTHTHTG